MSKLSELLNPAPEEPSHEAESSPPAHSLPHAQPLTSPFAHEQYESQSYGAFPQQDYGAYASNRGRTPSFEAASTLTALATSGGSYSPPKVTASPRAAYHSPPLQSNERFASPTLPPLSTSARRPSFGLPPIHPGYAPQSHSPTHDLERYHQKSTSRSPDSLRRQSQPTFDAGAALAPIHEVHVEQVEHQANRTPHAQGSSARSALTSNSDLENNPQHSQHHYHRYTPPSHISNARMESPHPETVQQVTTKQIREPSAAAPEAKMIETAPEPAVRQPLDEPTSPPKIKTEQNGTPREGTPVKRGESAPGEDVDEATLKAIEAAQNGFSLRAARQKAQPSIEEPVPEEKPATGTSKKRPAPKVKKGQATVKKPPSKKRRVDDAASTTSSTLKASPFGGKKSKSNTPALGSSPAPGSVVSGEPSQYGSSDGEDGVFCICRKGDNHTWMIGCDGGCEDWFHGKCVSIREEDGALIDKYICAECSKKTGKVTTWLPGCRNQNCRKPARIKKNSQSKYCSDECGREFMEGELKRGAESRRKASGKGAGGSKPKRKGITMAEINGDAGGDSDDDMGPRGGALKPSELKALITSTGDIDAFRALGQGVLSPPATASPTAERFRGAEGTDATSSSLLPADEEKIKSIHAKKDILRKQRALLKDREKFGQMIRENVTKYAEREGLKPKDICGYDSRLAWGDEEFEEWRDSEVGRTTLSSGELALPEDPAQTNGVHEDAMDVDGESKPPVEAAIKTDHKHGTLCIRKRCERHRQWQKQALADVRFEESQLADQMRALEAEEKEVKEAALLRARMDGAGLNGEGTVEVVGE